MRKIPVIIFIAAIFFLAAFWLQGRLRGMQHTNVPGLCVNTNVLDLGFARTADTLHGEFLLQNCGSGELRFIKATPECTCTVADSASRGLTPGQSMKLPVSLQVATGTDAVISKRIGVTVSRNGTEATIALRVVARVDNGKFLMAIPARVDLGYVEQGKPVTRKIYLRGAAGELDGLPDEVQILSSQPVHIRPTFVKASDKLEYKPLNIILRLEGDARRFSSTIVIDIPDKNLKPLIVPIRAEPRSG